MLQFIEPLKHIIQRLLQCDLSQPECQSVIDKIPASIYWKDREGVYQGQNIFAKSLMLRVNIITDANDFAFIGTTDEDYFDTNSVKQFRSNDMAIMNNDIDPDEQIIERVMTPNLRILPQISLKYATKNSKQQVTGVLGCTIPIYQYLSDGILSSQSTLSQYKPMTIKEIILDLLSQKNESSLKELVDYIRYVYSIKPKNKLSKQIAQLSHRELECACLAARNCSVKEMANILNISARTVETFLLRTKQKLDLTVTSQLSDWIWTVFSTQ